MDTTNYLTFIFKIAGSLALLIYGMKIMSEALQKMAGPQLRHVLGAMTTNRFTGVLTGTFITSAVQSSTATTVMTVSFVSAGLLTLTQAISVIMGANAHSLDHVAGLLVRPHELCFPRLSSGHCANLFAQAPLQRRFSFWYIVSLLQPRFA